MRGLHLSGVVTACKHLGTVVTECRGPQVDHLELAEWLSSGVRDPVFFYLSAQPS